MSLHVPAGAPHDSAARSSGATPARWRCTPWWRTRTSAEQLPEALRGAALVDADQAAATVFEPARQPLGRGAGRGRAARADRWGRAAEPCWSCWSELRERFAG
ncbi:hypothetical protein QJS66_07490 [Kocuria rhizophila]|nr:hypothetical protein QJS66_07490 [Kocuria rhizophila]